MEGQTRNPFQPPQADLQVASSAQPLYSLAGIGLATFFGTPLAGAWLLAHDLKALGKHDRLPMLWGLSVALLVATLVLAFVLPEEVPALPFAIAQLFAMMALARHLIEAEIKHHVAAGGVFLSNWRAVGIGLLVTLGFAALMFVVLMVIGV